MAIKLYGQGLSATDDLIDDGTYQYVKCMDGTGNGMASTITVLSNQEVNWRKYNKLYVVEDSTTRVFGPYDIQSLQVTGENRQQLIRGTQGFYWEARFAAQQERVENALLEEFEKLFDSYRTIEPYKTWWRRDYIYGLVRDFIIVDIQKARNFGDLVQAVERWGFTAWTQETDLLSSTNPVVRIRHKYPISSTKFFPGDVLRKPLTGPTTFTPARRNATLSRDAEVGSISTDTIADWANRPGLYRARHIVSAILTFGLAEDTDLFFAESGSLEPTLFLDPQDGEGLADLSVQLARWDLQNTAVTVSVPVRNNTNIVVPGQVLELDLDEGDMWRVVSVEHVWDWGTNAFVQTYNLALHQGFLDNVTVIEDAALQQEAQFIEDHIGP